MCWPEPIFLRGRVLLSASPHRVLVYGNFASIRKADAFDSVVHPGPFSDCRTQVCANEQVSSRLGPWVDNFRKGRMNSTKISFFPMVSVGVVFR